MHEFAPLLRSNDQMKHLHPFPLGKICVTNISEEKSLVNVPNSPKFMSNDVLHKPKKKKKNHGTRIIGKYSSRDSLYLKLSHHFLPPSNCFLLLIPTVDTFLETYQINHEADDPKFGTSQQPITHLVGESINRE